MQCPLKARPLDGATQKNNIVPLSNARPIPEEEFLPENERKLSGRALEQGTW